MQQPCPRCGYVSDRPARFCRQCGTSLLTETEATSAETRNYESRRSSQPYPTPEPPQSSGYSESTPETTRFYQPPTTPNYAPYTIEPPKKSQAGLWTLVAFLSLLLVGGGMIGMVSYAIRSRNYANNQSEIPEDLEQRRNQLKDEIDKLKEEVKKAQEMADRAKKEADREAGGPGAVPPLPHPPPPPPSAPGTVLEKYKYPNATIDPSSKYIGNVMLNMRTKDGLDKIREFYRKLIGDPLIEDNNELVFQSSGTPNLIIAIEPDEEHDGQFQITIFRPGFQIPKPN